RFTNLNGDRMTNFTVTPLVTSVSAASYAAASVAADSIVAAYGLNLATTMQPAPGSPLPTNLGGTTVKVRDAAGVERLAPLFFVSPNQVNYQMPPETSLGNSIVTITNGAGALATGPTQISGVSPGLFSAAGDGQGFAAATVLRVKATG